MNNFLSRSVRVLFCITLASIGAGAAKAASSENPKSAYEQAVQAYVAAATDELKALHQIHDGLSRDASAETQKRIKAQDVQAKLGVCDAALEALKKATQPTFDKAKAEYEKARTAVAQALAAVKAAPAAAG